MPLRGRFLPDPGSRDGAARHTVWGTRGEANLIYAIFMVLVLLTLIAAWRQHVLELPLFAVAVVWLLVHLVADMTTSLTLSF